MRIYFTSLPSSKWSSNWFRTDTSKRKLLGLRLLSWKLCFHRSSIRQFHQLYTQNFFVGTTFRQLFSTYVSKKKLPQQHLYEKRARLTLMKLTTCLFCLGQEIKWLIESWKNGLIDDVKEQKNCNLPILNKMCTYCFCHTHEKCIFTVVCHGFKLTRRDD